MPRYLKLFIAVFLAVVFVSGRAYADERIISFHSDVTVNEDSSMTVKETIKARAEGKEIKHGIYRDFPTRYDDREGKTKRVGFEVISAVRDGSPEPYFQKSMGNGVRVYIGDKNNDVPKGEHTYELTYRTSHQLGYFDEYDELYWNVTGNDWAFQIDKASAVIHLPSDAGSRIIKTSGYTGYQGSTEQEYAGSVGRDGVAAFETTRGLEAREGFTIVVSWPKGYVTKQPDLPPEKEPELISLDPKGIPYLLAGLFVICGYYLFVWFMAGRDPEGGPIVVEYTPPMGMTPPVMRYISRMEFDNKCMASSIINIAVKGGLKITDDDGEYLLTAGDEKKAALSEEEKRVYNELLGSGRTLRLERTNHAVIRMAIKELENFLVKRFDKVYFVTNKGYFIFGLVLTAIALLVGGVASAPDATMLAPLIFICVWLTGWSAGVIALLSQVKSAWSDVISSRKILEKGVSIVGALFITAFSIPFVGGELAGMFFLSTVSSIYVPVALIIAMGINYLFFVLLKAPTLAGRKVIDKIEGFRRFLSATEQDRMNMLNPPDRTPELFERYLAYALALDVEQQWAEQFSGIMDKAAAAAEAGGYSPSWYAGSSWRSLGASAFASDFGSSFSNAISSSSTAPGSSSGSSGGSSGGGGGGGGGGGW